MGFDTSIIILGHNDYETTTGPCLESLFMDPYTDLCEIVVVDNASQDSTPTMLKKFSSEKSNFKAVFNKDNRGFPGGSNDGVNEAAGNILILLNSDTIVPAGAIKKLSSSMENNPALGMLGPVTNAAGTEQKIYVASSDIDDAVIEGENFCSHSGDDFFPIERLDFFCVAIRKDVYNSLDGLDERFGLGYYEDLDFSFRAKRAGVTMMFTEDCFIYHSAGKTFSNVGRKNVKKLMHDNKVKLKKKYSGKIELFHLRDRNMKIMNEYVRLKKKSSPERHIDLEYRFNNRMALAESIYPHSVLKKVMYKRKLKRLAMEFLSA